MNIKNLSLPPGFRFHPTDQELIVHYLKKKVSSPQSPAVSIIADVDLYKYNPWQLPEMAFFGDGEWFFFSPRDRKYPNGARPNRAAASGYWKATGTDKPILTSGGSECIGVKKHLVFFTGRPPKGMKTDWVMYEYRLLDNRPDSMKLSGSMRLDDWVLCRVRQKTNNPPQTEEKEEDRLEQLSMNGDSLFEGIDHQMPPPYQLGKVDENVDTIENMNDVTSQQSEGSHSSLSQVLDSIKRTLSLGGLDEYMLSQPPSKRPNVNSSMDEFPPSDSVSSSFSEF